MGRPIRENIMSNLITTLQAITTGNGYKNTIRGVFRYEQDGNSSVEQPFIEIIPVSEEIKQSPNPYATCTLSINIDVWLRHDKSDYADSTDAYLITFLADITKALMADYTRGGYAVNTMIMGNFPFTTVEGQPYSGITVTVDILYRHLLNDIEAGG